MLIDQVDDLFVDLATENHFNQFHRFSIGYPHALNELTFFSNAGEQAFNLWSAAVDDDYIETDQLEQDYITSEALLQMFVSHCVAAIFDDDGFTVDTLDIGQGFSQNGGLDAGGEVF
jgi:hypothetical protein